MIWEEGEGGTVVVERGTLMRARERESIDVQMGQARWAGTGTALKSTDLTRHGTKGIVPRAGPTRWSDRAWAAP
jgi:hypothetical protein